MSSSNGLRQARRLEPLVPSLVDRTEVLRIVGLRCRITFRIEVGSGQPPVPISFAVDSGASHSLIGLELAESRHLPVPPAESEIDLDIRTARGTTPIRVRPGRIRVWWHTELQGHPFDWPVLFRVGAPLGVPAILGLGGIVKTCRWTFDGTYSPSSPFGYLSLDDIR